MNIFSELNLWIEGENIPEEKLLQGVLFWWTVVWLQKMTFFMLFSFATSFPLPKSSISILSQISCCYFICAIIGSAWLGWNTSMCIWDIKFASCTAFSSNRSWFELVWAGVCIFRQGMVTLYIVSDCLSRAWIISSLGHVGFSRKEMGEQKSIMLQSLSALGWKNFWGNLVNLLTWFCLLLVLKVCLKILSCTHASCSFGSYF